ncbi:hypothetical protein OAK99_02810, partial [Akkermansiaceae bacterium]|nr:hypothetical protein [Akkermansiaceae bacterium]
GSKLVEKRGVFTVKAIVKMEGPAADKRWMPDFPGVADVESARDWEPGLPLDLTRIRDKDDEYWEEFKGTPKAFVSHQTGERQPTRGKFLFSYWADVSRFVNIFQTEPTQ